MKQSVQPGFYWDDDLGREVEIRAGAVRPDRHPDVLRMPGLFRDVDIDEPEPPPRPAPRSARPASRAR